MNDFTVKNYPQQILDTALRKVENLNRNDLIKKKVRTNTDNNENTYMSCMFRPNYQKVPKLVKNNWDILARSATTKDLHRTSLRIGYRRLKNLRDMLVRAKTDFHPNEKDTEKEKTKCCEGRNKCKKKNCKYCKILKSDRTLFNHNRKYNTKNAITCNRSNVIYCIECTQCQKKYVGQTKRKIKDRMREHMYNVTRKKNNDVSHHFNMEHHKGVENMKFYILDYIYKHPESKRAKTLRNKLEFNWIHRLQTQSPQGMNVLDNRYG